MPMSSNPRQADRRQFHAHDIDATVAAILRDIRRRAPDPQLQGDSALMIACAAAADLWDRNQMLFHGTGDIDHEDRRDLVVQMLWDAAEPVLRRICDLRATTFDGHRARGAVFLAWDAGELLARAGLDGVLDRLALAMVCDLLGDGDGPYDPP